MKKPIIRALATFLFFAAWLAVGIACQTEEHKAGTSYPTPTGTGVPVIVSGHYSAAALSGDAGQILTWYLPPGQGAVGVPRWQSGASVFTAGGDLTGTSTEQTVIGIRNQPVTAATSGQGAVFYFSDAGWTGLAAGDAGQMLQTNGVAADPTWVTPNPAFTAATDLSGSATTQTVVGFRGIPLVAAAGSAPRGNMLYVGASGWTPLAVPSSSASVLGFNGTDPAWVPQSAAAVLPHDLDGFRLSLTSGLDVTTSNVTAAGTIYGVPTVRHGGQISLYTSSAWEILASAQFSYTVSCTSGDIKDLFAYNNAGAATFAASAAWASASTRTDALGTQDGVTVLASDHAKRWVGTFKCSGTNVVEDSNSKRFLWNAYNQVPRALHVTEATTTWTYATAAWHSVNANAANSFSYVTGDTTYLTVRAYALASSSSGAQGAATGVGVDSTTVNSAIVFGADSLQAGASQRIGEYHGYPATGYRLISWIEYGGVNSTWYGAPSAGYQTGMIGEILAMGDAMGGAANDNGIEERQAA